MTGALERRAFEFRAADTETGLPALEGVVVPYGDRAQIAGRFTEEFRAGSITLRSVVANVMHRRDRPLARAGHGLTLTDGPTALRARLELPDTTEGRDVAELVRGHVLTGFSAEFRATRDRWEGRHRIIEAADLHRLAVVDTPAYAGAVITEGRMIELGDWLEHQSAGQRRARRWRSL